MVPWFGKTNGTVVPRPMAIYICSTLPRWPGWRNPLTLHTDPARPHGPPRAVRLAIVDDHEVFRMGLRSLLGRAPRLEVVWDTASAHDAFERLQQEPVDAILMDINLGGPIDGVQATDRMLGAWPG